MPSGVYKRKWYENVHGTREVVVDTGIAVRTFDGSHDCLALAYSNEGRVSRGESTIYVFQDIDNNKWNIRLGLEFIEVNCCPFCSSKLYEEKS
jgi:hypothetical protein